MAYLLGSREGAQPAVGRFRATDKLLASTDGLSEGDGFRPCRCFQDGGHPREPVVAGALDRVRRDSCEQRPHLICRHRASLDQRFGHFLDLGAMRRDQLFGSA